MQRLFAEHRVRRVESLDGLWRLTPRDAAYEPCMAGVPGVWERIVHLACYRGVADYCRRVTVDEAGAILLRFGGVSHTARVFWDGEAVGEHYNAFTGFDVLLERVPAGVHELRVEVDDRYSDASALHIPNDYMTYGGINRPVEMHHLPGVWIERMAFHAVELGEERFEAHVRVFVRAIEAPRGPLMVSLSLAGAEQTLSLPQMGGDGSAELDFCLQVSGVARWDLHAGNLYDLTARILDGERALDDLTDRVGFRTVALHGQDILLNGRKVRIKGFNRHEDHRQFGCAIPPEAMLDDLQLIMSMGGNSIRTCHYPNDPRFLDLCDELGLLVWEESHARAVPEKVFHSALFARQCADCNAEMIAQHVNHPCIYVWGLLNECESETPFGRGVYSAQIDQLRALDPTRPISFASCRLFTDICLDLVDIASFNIYPGWYAGETPAEMSRRLFAWMDGHGAADKPILISEIGAGAIAGFHDPISKALWSEERQDEILEAQLTAIHADPRCSGTYIWQFADVRVDESWAMNRPKTVNNKGVVDGFRQPKLCCGTIRRIYSALPDTK